MRKYLPFLCIPLLASCAADKPSMEYVAREIAPDEYEIKLKVEDDVEMQALKEVFIVRGDELCGHRIFRLRGMREDTYFDPPAQELKGHIECMS